MLISLEDMSGNVYWINPIYVREIKAIRNGCKMILSGGKTIRMPVEAGELALRLNEGMPLPSETIAALLDQPTQTNPAAAVIAAT